MQKTNKILRLIIYFLSILFASAINVLLSKSEFAFILAQAFSGNEDQTALLAGTLSGILTCANYGLFILLANRLSKWLQRSKAVQQSNQEVDERQRQSEIDCHKEIEQFGKSERNWFIFSMITVASLFCLLFIIACQ